MKNIIVPLDFSNEALRGLELAVLIANQTPVTIQIVYVQKKTDVPSASEEEFKHADKNLHKIAEQYRPQLKNGSTISYIIKKGKIYQEIVGQAQAFTDSLIVASTHGASGFEELFIGSNAYKVVCATSRPVITVRQGPIPETIRKILLPIDIAVESRQKVVYTALFAKLFGAEVDVVTVSSSKSKKVISRLNAYCVQVCKFLGSQDVPYKSHAIFANNPIEDLLNYSKNNAIDMIAIINESGESITDLIINGEAQQMISRSPIPVLTIRAKPHTIKESFSTFGG